MNAVHRRVVGVAVAATLSAAAVVLLGLEMIGPPPSVRVDSMWVHDHRAAVRTVLVAAGIAIGGFVVAVILRSGRIATAVGCVLLVAAVTWRYPERVRVIASVLWSRYG